MKGFFKPFSLPTFCTFDMFITFDLANGTLRRGRPTLRFKDTLKNVTSHCGLSDWGIPRWIASNDE